MKNIIKRSINKISSYTTKQKQIKIEKEFPPDFDSSSIEIINNVDKYTMTSNERLFSLIKAIKYVVENNIEGDFVECGVWKGGSSMAMAYSLNLYSEIPRQIYLFDTFSGMSSPTQKDISYSGFDATSLLEKSNIKDCSSIWCYASLDEVQTNMAKTGYNMNLVRFIQGKVEDTIPKFAPDKIALLRLDTDWYESTYHELKHLFPRLVQGGVIIIDDYGYWQGCREATDKYIKENNIQIMLNRIDMTGRIGIKF